MQPSTKKQQFSFKKTLPKESYHFSQPQEKFFVFAEEDNQREGHLKYGLFLRYYERMDSGDPLFDAILDATAKLDSFDCSDVFVPRYIVFFTKHPLFLTFKSLMLEVVSVAAIESDKNIDLDKFLEALLYKIPLPSRYDTQVSFTFGSSIFNICNSPYGSDVSLKLLFHFFRPADVCILMLAFLTDSVIVFVHSQFLLN